VKTGKWGTNRKGKGEGLPGRPHRPTTVSSEASWVLTCALDVFESVAIQERVPWTRHHDGAESGSLGAGDFHFAVSSSILARAGSRACGSSELFPRTIWRRADRFGTRILRFGRRRSERERVAAVEKPRTVTAGAPGRDDPGIGRRIGQGPQGAVADDRGRRRTKPGRESVLVLEEVGLAAQGRHGDADQDGLCG